MLSRVVVVLSMLSPGLPAPVPSPPPAEPLPAPPDSVLLMLTVLESAAYVTDEILADTERLHVPAEGAVTIQLTGLDSPGASFPIIFALLIMQFFEETRVAIIGVRSLPAGWLPVFLIEALNSKLSPSFTLCGTVIDSIERDWAIPTNASKIIPGRTYFIILAIDYQLISWTPYKVACAVSIFSHDICESLTGYPGMEELLKYK